MKEQIEIDDKSIHILDAMNPPGMFLDGQRQREYSAKDMLPMSGKLIPEFDGRRNIRDMFARKPSLPKSQSIPVAFTDAEPNTGISAKPFKSSKRPNSQVDASGMEAATRLPAMGSAPVSSSKKRPISESSAQRTLKRPKSGAVTPAPAPTTGKGQRSLKGFFSTATATQRSPDAPSFSNGARSEVATCSNNVSQAAIDLDAKTPKSPPQKQEAKSLDSTSPASSPANQDTALTGTSSVQVSPSKSDQSPCDGDTVHDPVQSMESWSKLFTKPAAPRCEGHDEPCKTMLTKKNGMNRGRSFWMCARPLGPTGEKEKNTQWRCHTFIWCSDWNPTTAS